jgi:hypothetical protein
MASVREADLRPFNESGYEILDEDLLTKGEVVLWSVDPLPPDLGELYTVESHGKVHEIEVEEVATFRGGWSARCRLYGLLAG